MVHVIRSTNAIQTKRLTANKLKKQKIRLREEFSSSVCQYTYSLEIYRKILLWYENVLFGHGEN